jgi:hypothetical protein
MQRLLTGRPRHTDGRLTKSNLYREAQVSRATMNRAKALLAEWDTRVAERAASRGKTDTASQEIKDLRRRLAKANERADNLQLKVDAAATVIGLLHADHNALRERPRHAITRSFHSTGHEQPANSQRQTSGLAWSEERSEQRITDPLL